MTFHPPEIDATGVTLRLTDHNLIARLARKRKLDLTAPNPGEPALAVALAELAILSQERPGAVSITADCIRIDHDAVAELDGATAQALGLPPVPDLRLRTDVDGMVGGKDFRLRARWEQDGTPVEVRRTGAILHGPRGDRRLPRAILDVLEVAENAAPRSLEAQWETLARFRRALGAVDEGDCPIAMTQFLSGLELDLVSELSIDPRDGAGGLDFEVVARGEGGEELGTADAMVAGLVRKHGARGAYRVGSGRFLVIDGAARPVLEAMVTNQRAPAAIRDAFVRNPIPAIRDAVEQDLERRGALAGLEDVAREETVAAASASYVEMSDYAERVTGIERYRPDRLPKNSSGEAWRPETWDTQLAEAISNLPNEALDQAVEAVATALDQANPPATIEVEGIALPVGEGTVKALHAELKQRVETSRGSSDPEGDEEGGSVILGTRSNEEEETFHVQVRGRDAGSDPERPPRNLKTKLRDHQILALDWQDAAWRSGLPGVLNADEQGLGKTLQTIAFLAWLQDRMADDTMPTKPILVVAPTSLLRTWENEVATHMSGDGLGTVVRLYGSGLGQLRIRAGRETMDGEARLDLSLIEEMQARGRPFWLLTTYQTLTAYQHSLGRIPFAVAVFDEIQALKNPASLAHRAALAMNADFRIGLTGTPVENDIVDIWAVMEQIAPGLLGSRRAFRDAHPAEDTEALSTLHDRLFTGLDGFPPLALRRLKVEVARDLPPKRHLLVPQAMPERQSAEYDSARALLRNGDRSAALRHLQHIRSVSLHPAPDLHDDFSEISARVAAVLNILDRVRAAGEKALLFLDDRRMQSRMVATLRARYDLPSVDVINGSASIPARQAAVDRLQSGPDGFAVMILSPKAAGTGLTLTRANHVIHLSRWWNPAVEAQCDDRVHRIGQDRPVTVHIPMAIHPKLGEASFDCVLHGLMERKRRVARDVLAPSTNGDQAAQELLEDLGTSEGTRGTSEEAVIRVHQRLGLPIPDRTPEGLLCLR